MNWSYKDSFKKKVISLRKKGLTHEEISIETHVPMSTVGNWIREAMANSKKSRDKLIPKRSPRK